MQEANTKIIWLNNILITAIIILTLLSFTSSLFHNILESMSGNGSVTEYVLLLAYIVPVSIIFGLLRNIRWVYLVAGIWCLISATFILFAILFTPVGGAIWLMSGQCLLLVMLSVVAFFLWKKLGNLIFKNKNMNQQIVDYLQQNKTAYPKEALMQQLRTSGYVEGDIQEALRFVYGIASRLNNIFIQNTPGLQVNMNKKQLKLYIFGQLNSGILKSEIESSLANAGYT